MKRARLDNHASKSWWPSGNGVGINLDLMGGRGESNPGTGIFFFLKMMNDLLRSVAGEHVPQALTWQNEKKNHFFLVKNKEIKLNNLP